MKAWRPNMCKIITIVNGSKVIINDKLLNTLKNALCERDKDGFGYSVQGQAGLYGERTLDTQAAFKSRLDTHSKTAKASFIERRSNSYGKRSKTAGSIMAHGRMSTNHVSLPCTHPYVENDTALIHNGVVRDMAAKPIECATGNDTEIIFQYWMRRGLDDILAHVSGYYALSIQEGDLTHIIKDDTAQLVVSWCSTIDSYIFATNAGIIEQVAKKMKWAIEPSEKVKDNIHIAFKGNEVVHESRIVPRRAEVDAHLVSRSLGWIESEPEDRLLTPEHRMQDYETSAYDSYTTVQEYLSDQARKTG